MTAAEPLAENLVDCDHPHCAEYGDYTIGSDKPDENGEQRVFRVCWAHTVWAKEGGKR